jgi:Nucleotidyl transferase AbiEii toxin, Type IV TA system
MATMMSRGQANTRDRDFADVVMLSRIHAVDAAALRDALQRTAEHRGHPLSTLADLLDGHAKSRQATWTTLRQRSGLDTLPADFGQVVAEVVRFTDPLIEDADGIAVWAPESGR